MDAEQSETAGFAAEDACPPATMIRNNTINLRQEILPLIQPYATAGCPQHAFTAGEIIVIAIIGLAEPAVTEEQIVHYICTHFCECGERTILDHGERPSSIAR